MKALVTGGGGFLGRGIVNALLARGDQVSVLARGHYPDLEQAGARCLRADITDAQAVAQAMAGQEVVLHGAAKAGDGGSFDSYYRPNVLGTRTLLQAAVQAGVRGFVHTSTPSVVIDTGAAQPWWRAWSHPGEGIQAGTTDLPYAKDCTSFYSRTKAMGEMIALAAGRDEHSELAVTALRPHLIWGPGDTQLIPRLIKRARQGRLRLVGDGTNVVDTTYIDDAVAAHLCAADALSGFGRAAASSGQVYFISSGDPQPLATVINSALAAAGLPPENRQLPFSVAYAAGAVAEAACHTWRHLTGREVEPLMSRFLARQLATSHWFDIEPAHHDLGYHPDYTVAEGMKELALWLARSPAPASKPYLIRP